jgi:hypothetical protein
MNIAVTAETRLGADALVRTSSARCAFGPAVLRTLLVYLNLLDLAAASYDERAALRPALEATAVPSAVDRPRVRPRGPLVRVPA